MTPAVFHSWPHRSPRRRLFPLAFATLLAAQTLPARSATPDTFTGQSSTLWSDPTNWTAGTPNSSAFDVYLTNSAGLSALLDAKETIDTLAITSPNTLTLQSATTLTLSGTSLSNTGTILINSTGTLSFTTNATISGGGTIDLPGLNSSITASGGAILYSDNLISGQGVISPFAFVNAGTISATTGFLNLNVSALTNNALLTAAGGTLAFHGSSLNNAAGMIEAQSGGTISLAGTIVGGTIQGDAGGIVHLVGGLQNTTLNGNLDVSASESLASQNTNTGTLTVAHSAIVSEVSGTLTNSGDIVLNGVLAFNNTQPVLNGAGTISMGKLSSISGKNLLTSSNVISGQGVITVPGIANSGTITATANALTFQSNSLTNTGLLSANGGQLVFTYPVSITNIQGNILATNNSSVLITGNVLGGTVTAQSGGTVALGGAYSALLQTPGNTGTITLGGSNGIVQNSTLNGYFEISNAGLATLTGSLTVNGLLVDPLNGLLTLNLATLTGAGSLVLSHPAPITGGTLNSNLPILGSGSITLKNFTNNSLVNARPGDALYLQATSPSTNAGTLQSSGGTLSLSLGIMDNTNGILDAGNGTLFVSGVLQGGTITGSGGKVLGIAGLSGIPDHDLSLQGTFTLGTGGLAAADIDGVVNLVGYQDLIGNIIINGSAILARATLQLNNSFLSNNGIFTGTGQISGTGTFSNTGLILAASASGLLFSLPLSNTATLRADGGILDFARGVTSPTSGTIEAIDNGRVFLDGEIQNQTLNASNGGSFSSDSGGQLAFAGLDTVNTVLTGITPSFYDGTTLSGSGSIVLAGNTLGFGQKSQGSSITNQITLQGSGNFPFAGLNSGTITAAGAIHPYDALTISPGPGTLTNTGLIQSSTNALTLNGKFVNSGQIIQAATASATTISTTGMVNTGLILASAGSLNLSGPINNAGGLIQSTNGAPISISNATITGGSLTTSGVLLPPYLFPDEFVFELTPPTVSISNSLLQLDSFSSTAFTAPGSVSLQATTISVTNSTLSVADGLTLLNGANLTFNSGSLTVQGPITLNYLDNLSDPFAQAFPHISFNSTIPNSQNVSTISGTGGGVYIGPGASLTCDGDTIGALLFDGSSKMTIRPNGADSGTSKFTLYEAAGTMNHWTSTLDTTNNKLIIQTRVYPPYYPPDVPHTYDKPSQMALIINQIQSARDTGPSGPWTGTGITSSTAAADPNHLTLAMFDNADLGFTTWGGQSVDTNSLLITVVPIADATLDGSVDAGDFNAWYSHRMTDSYSYAAGDFNMDGVVDGQDFTIWYNALGPTAANPILQNLNLDPTTLAALRAAPVPEPASLALLLLITPLLLRQKRPQIPPAKPI